MNRKYFKKAISILTVTVTLFSTACASNTGDSGNNATPLPTTSGVTQTPESSAPVVEQKQEPYRLSFVNRISGADYVADDNPVIKLIEEKANVILDIELPPASNYEERMNIKLASGDLPDLMFYGGNTQNFRSYSQEGIFLPVDEYIKDLPNIQEKVNTRDILEHAYVPETGFHHAIPRPHIANDWGILIRQDWFDKLNIKAPNTPEEFIECAKLITAGDPNNTGKAGTYGTVLAPEGWAGIRDNPVIRSGFGIVDTMYAPDGIAMLIEEQEGFLPMMDFYRTLYETGGLDPEFYLIKYGVEEDKFKAGNIGMNVVNCRARDIYRFLDLNMEDPDYKLDFLPPLQDSNGQRNLYGAPSIWGSFVVTSASKDPQRVFDFIDWCLSDEGQRIMVVGIQGLTYETYDSSGLIVKTDEQSENAKKWVSTSMSFGYVDSAGVPIITWGRDQKEAEELQDYWQSYNKIVTKNNVPIVDIMGLGDAQSAMLDLDTTRDENMVKYIIGQISRDELESFLNDVYLPVARTQIKPLFQEAIDSLK